MKIDDVTLIGRYDELAKRLKESKKTRREPITAYVAVATTITFTIIIIGVILITMIYRTR